MTTTTMPAVSPETVTPLRPSEALRLGRLTRPVQISGDFYGDDGEACALGAILTGSGHELDAGFSTLRWLYPRMDALAACPVNDSHCIHDPAPTVVDIVYGLNDLHDWPDDQIVGWLESLGL